MSTSLACSNPCNVGTNLKFSCLEPEFTTMMNLVREYNLGSAACKCESCEDYPSRYPIIRYIKNVTPKTQYLDDLHQEVLSPDEQFEDTLPFRALVVVQPVRSMLTKYGIDDERDGEVYDTS